MEQRGCREEDAHRALQRLAMEGGTRLVAVAQEVIRVAEVFRPSA